ncbi:MAG: Asp-tRNA(Asn)/Glu-tRNA(Gln) amidotransferase subunit GatC [Syntrophales bacterium]|nr:Asp-tRNA(Asn)/Glu-tRNA(Gln) amidotransferase subunit GatC [Syntrophales bacterium]
MKISREEVLHIAHLARLEFEEEEIELFTVQLNEILSYIDKLNAVATKGVEPMTHATALYNVFREDRVENSLKAEEAVANAPDSIGTLFRVPRIID